MTSTNCPKCNFEIYFEWGEYPYTWQILECPKCNTRFDPKNPNRKIEKKDNKMSVFPKNTKGQSLVEFAIGITILLILLSGVVEFAFTFFQYVQLRDAVQEGALYGSVHPDNVSKIEEYVRASSNSPVNLSDNAVVVQVNFNGQPCEGNSLTVHAFYSHQIFMPFFPKIINRDNIPLHTFVTDTILSPVCK